MLFSCIDNTDEPINTEESVPETEEPTKATERQKSTKPPKKTQNIEITDENSIGARVMSFNLRFDEFTPERIDLVFKMIEIYKPDSIGFQEATDEWMEVLGERLGDTYEHVGCGRDEDRKGEANPVFYLKSRFTLIEENTLWLSNSPEVAGSKLHNSSHPRIFTYAVLQETETGKTYTHINTHLDHTIDTARERQTELLLEHLKAFEDRKLSYVLTGDFNDKSSSKTYSTIMSYGLVNSSSFATKSEPGPTYHGYGTTERTIDFIFVAPSTTLVDFYKSCTDTFTDEEGNIAYPSDHNPIIADIKILGKTQ
jgi:endonuclease/exonuclease/phosphatase family metal-dependent hydrolase